MRGMGEVHRFRRLKWGDPEPGPIAAGAPRRPGRGRLRLIVNLAMALVLAALLAVIVLRTDWRAVRAAAMRLGGTVIEAVL